MGGRLFNSARLAQVMGVCGVSAKAFVIADAQKCTLSAGEGRKGAQS